jgi:hypothetical protein
MVCSGKCWDVLTPLAKCLTHESGDAGRHLACLAFNNLSTPTENKRVMTHLFDEPLLPRGEYRLHPPGETRFILSPLENPYSSLKKVEKFNNKVRCRVKAMHFQFPDINLNVLLLEDNVFD